MKLLLFAHPNEARKTLEAFPTKQLREDLFAFDYGYILITGMGLYRSLFSITAFCQTYSHKITEIINLGFSASLDPNLPIGSIAPVEKVEKWIEHPPLDQESLRIKESCAPTFTLPTSGKRLISVEYSIFNLESRNKLKNQADLIDMEGYSVCFANQFFKKKIIIRKVVSDLASSDGREKIKKNHIWLSALLAKESLKLLIT